MNSEDFLPLFPFCESLSPFLAPLLSSESYLFRLSSFAKELPASICTKAIGFEFSLSEEGEIPDITFALHPEASGFFGSHCLDQLLKKDPSWGRFSQFMEQEMNSPLAREISRIWISLDFIPLSEKSPFSSPNFYLFPSAGVDLEKFREKVGATLCPENATPSLPLSQSFPDPENLEPLAFGWMCARKDPGCRVLLKNQVPLTKSRLSPYLEDSPQKETFLYLIDQLQPLLGHTHLLLDLRSPPHSPIGIECYLPKELSAEEQKKRWASIFAYGVEKGIILKDKALLHFLSWFGGQLEERRGSLHRFVRVISHIKFLYQPHAPIRAKLYLGAHHRLLPNCIGPVETPRINRKSIEPH